MSKRKDRGIDIAYIAPRDPETIPIKDRLQYAVNVQNAMEEIHKVFSK